MDPWTFEDRLIEATAFALSFAHEFVRRPLPGNAAYLVYPNQSYDGHARADFETVYPGDSLPDLRDHLGPWSAIEAVAYLFRGGEVPEWIDISVEAVDRSRTMFALRCCGRYTAREDLLYYRERGLPPFGIKSPPLPRGWTSVEESGPIDLDQGKPPRRSPPS